MSLRTGLVIAALVLLAFWIVPDPVSAQIVPPPPPPMIPIPTPLPKELPKA